MQISDLGLSVRTTNCLHRAGIMTVEELRQKRTWELQGIRSFGAKCMQEVREALERLEGKPVILRWIPVAQRLPEKEGRYLCVKRVGKSGSVYVQIMNGDSYGFSLNHIYDDDDVTHWAPLPEPPGEGRP